MTASPHVLNTLVSWIYHLAPIIVPVLWFVGSMLLFLRRRCWSTILLLVGSAVLVLGTILVLMERSGLMAGIEDGDDRGLYLQAKMLVGVGATVVWSVGFVGYAWKGEEGENMGMRV